MLKRKKVNMFVLLLLATLQKNLYLPSVTVGFLSLPCATVNRHFTLNSFFPRPIQPLTNANMKHI